VDKYSDGRTVNAFKVVNLKLTPANANGVIITFVLDSRKVSSLQAWANGNFGGVQYGYFNDKFDCCATAVAAYPRG
jgi:hypothetical protein